MSKKTKMYLGVGVIVVAMMFLMVSGFSGGTGFQVSINDLILKGDQYADEFLLVEGKVLPETVTWDSDKIEVEFKVTDGSNEMLVLLNDVAPDNLDHEDGAEAILKGKYDAVEKVFKADTVETRCPSKYEAAEE